MNMSTISMLATGGRGVVLGLAIAAMAGCAVMPSGTANHRTAPPSSSADYLVCSGGHGSRFPGREAEGRVCRRATSLEVIL
jgi:hypothetical protein